MTKIALEFRGFVKYLSRANNHLVKWFGPYCNYEAPRITIMASREWEAMDDMERRYFIKANWLEDQRATGRKISDANSFLSYMLAKRYERDADPTESSVFSPSRAYTNHLEWKGLPQEEKEKYADTRLSDIGMDHVIDKRDILHEKYHPIELNRLECILKTKPRRPMSSHAWYSRINLSALDSKEMNTRWRNLDEKERAVYEGYSRFDMKRYSFEKKAWHTHLLMTDLESQDFCLEDYKLRTKKSSLETIISVVPPDKLFVPPHGPLKRPLSPFSLYVRAYRYQIRDQRPEFKFGDHLRMTSEAWAKLSDEEKQVYKDESARLWQEYHAAMKALEPDCYTLPENIFSHSKSLYGPSKPSHLISKIPSAMKLYSMENNINVEDRHKVWASLSDEEKAPWLEKQQEFENSVLNDRARVKEKLKNVKQLTEKAEALAKEKRKLKLLQTRNRNVKLYL